MRESQRTSQHGTQTHKLTLQKKLIKGLATRTPPNNFDDEMSCYTLFYMERIFADTL
jgi:hypothetical protein